MHQTQSLIPTQARNTNIASTSDSIWMLRSPVHNRLYKTRTAHPFATLQGSRRRV